MRDDDGYQPAGGAWTWLRRHENSPAAIPIVLIVGGTLGVALELAGLGVNRGFDGVVGGTLLILGISYFRDSTWPMKRPWLFGGLIGLSAGLMIGIVASPLAGVILGLIAAVAQTLVTSRRQARGHAR